MSLTNFSAIDLSRLPAPNLIESLSFEKIRAEILDDFKTRFPDAELNLISDPVVKLVESFAYRELLLRQRINDSAHAVLLAHATSSELDYLGNRFEVSRAILEPADNTQIPPKAAIYESDERYRERIALALEGFSTAGPAGAYAFHALKGSQYVKDVFVDAPEFAYVDLPEQVSSLLPPSARLLVCTYDAGLTPEVLSGAEPSEPVPGDVVVTLLTSQGNGHATTDVIEQVRTQLNKENVRPLTDRVHIKSADIIEFELDAVLHIYPGMDGPALVEEAKASLAAWLAEHHKLGHDISLSGLYAVLHREGVQRVELQAPQWDIAVQANQAAFCSRATISVGDEHV
ncbi:baseplate J/gp47 family protein [Pseudoalteromonas luteoviolacea]|uniref:baseplate assembly protein n=1 Tax=Pseudoalteromonas luteoviolacea TaxID=43657 RepID=UPI001B3A157F|nr:baseplate J/gp47 family protein [Pseudoalteromonas luteoviolacea]MBQ4878918.1 baseplate J/gp47 family protein [Pseudoalteromonas luteoviolacea]MBQ4907905.1 baseplate J/gp47 family protein [Pseudoalteromonas luteoviolacea]